MFQHAADAVHESVALYLSASHNVNAPRPSGHPLATLRTSEQQIAIYAEPDDPNALDLFARHVGSPTTHALLLGLGRDGREAAGILASIHVTG